MPSCSVMLAKKPAVRMTLYCFICATLISATSCAPTPLYPLYHTLFHLTPVMITLIFSSYAFSLLTALLTFGRLSDVVGRRPLILTALLLNTLALVIFMLAQTAHMLILARVVQGFATGIALPTFGAGILDSAPGRGAQLNSVTAFLGMLAGSLAGALLVTYAPWPTVLIYAVLTGLMAVALLFLAFMPETVRPVPFRLARLKPQIVIPAPALGPILRMAPVNVATWSLGGFYLSLMPALVAETTGIASPLVGGSVVTTLMLSATLSVFVFRIWQPQRALVIGTLALMAGTGVTLLGINTHRVELMFLGTTMAGQGFGSLFSTILRIILPLAESHERAGLFAAFLVKSYLAFALPAVGAGFAVAPYGLATTANGYCAGIMLMALISLVAGRVMLPMRKQRC